MQRELFRTNFETDLAWLKENGVTVVEPDRDAFIEAVQPVVAKYAEIYGVDLVQRIMDAE